MGHLGDQSVKRTMPKRAETSISYKPNEITPNPFPWGGGGWKVVRGWVEEGSSGVTWTTVMRVTTVMTV